MAKDFAAHSYKKSNKKNKVLLLVLLIVLLVSSFVSILWFNSKTSEAVEKPLESKSANSKALTEKPRFEFHDMVVIDETMQHADPKLVKGNFIVIIGNFRYMAEAKKMQLKLRRKGYDTIIRAITMDKTKLNQLVLGPFVDNFAALDKIRSLKQDKYHATLQQLATDQEL